MKSNKFYFLYVQACIYLNVCDSMNYDCMHNNGFQLVLYIVGYFDVVWICTFTSIMCVHLFYNIHFVLYH